MTKTIIESKTGPQSIFIDAEHLWFWFVSGRQIKNGLTRRGGEWFRPCELVDVETLITRMYLSGRLSADELGVIKKYGELRRAPNQYVFNENRDAILWVSAMRAISAAARKKGWVE